MGRVGAVSAVALGLSWAGCGGDDDTGGPTAGAGSCADYQTGLLADVPADEWPTGFSDALAAHQALAGRYTAQDCNDNTHTIEFITREDTLIEVVRQGVDPSLVCGCPEDPDHPVDEQMTPTGFVPAVEVYFNNGAEEFVDPSIDGEIIDIPFTMFGADQELLLRGCHTYDIDPFWGSAWDRASIVIRVETDGTLSGTIWLLEAVQGGAEEFCPLTGWTRVGD